MMMIRILHVCGVFERSANTQTQTNVEQNFRRHAMAWSSSQKCMWTERMERVWPSRQKIATTMATKTACACSSTASLPLSHTSDCLNPPQILLKVRWKIPNFESFSNCFEKIDSIRFYIHYTLSSQTAFIGCRFRCRHHHLRHCCCCSKCMEKDEWWCLESKGNKQQKKHNPEHEIFSNINRIGSSRHWSLDDRVYVCVRVASWRA